MLNVFQKLNRLSQWRFYLFQTCFQPTTLPFYSVFCRRNVFLNTCVVFYEWKRLVAENSILLVHLDSLLFSHSDSLSVVVYTIIAYCLYDLLKQLDVYLRKQKRGSSSTLVFLKINLSSTNLVKTFVGTFITSSWLELWSVLIHFLTINSVLTDRYSRVD